MQGMLQSSHPTRFSSFGDAILQRRGPGEASKQLVRQRTLSVEAIDSLTGRHFSSGPSYPAESCHSTVGVKPPVWKVDGRLHPLNKKGNTMLTRCSAGYHNK
eukprot:1187095-Prorocentrum_minimum.AAC.6